MTASTLKGRGPGSRLDTSYTSFESEKGVRSPRTPTYVPDSPLAQSVRPFDHAKLFNDATSEPENRSPLASPPPEKPMAWIWICHLCHSRYALGVTRRCLVDGHYYCSGESDKPSIREKKKHKACSSEFDYASWKLWSDWRRKVLRTIHNERVFRGCEYCNFPSQCRYAADTHPLGDLGTATLLSKDIVSEKAKETKTTAEQDKATKKSTANDKVHFDQILKNIFSDTDTGQLDLEKSKEPKQKKGNSKKRNVGSSIPRLELDLAGDDRTLHGLTKMDWSHCEEIGLGKTKIE